VSPLPPALPDTQPPAVASVRHHVPTRPRWLLPVCAATALYLVVELSFNARLLDVVGGSATLHEIDRIELWGRMISGFALALVFWPSWIQRAIERHPGRLRRARSLAARSLLAMLCMYLGQEALLRVLVHHSSTEQLRQAQHLVLLRSGLHAGAVELTGLPLTTRELDAPDGKAFQAMFPMMASGLGDVIGEQFGPEQRRTVTHHLVAGAMGDPNVRLNAYAAMLRELQISYGDYRKALSRIDASGADAWSRYVRKLRQRGFSPDGVPRRHHGRVRSQVQRDGVPVPSDWRPGDRRRFIEAATRSARADASRQFNEALGNQVPAFRGVSAPDSLRGFLTDPGVQPRILSALGYTCVQSFTADIPDAAAFNRHIHLPELQCQVDRQLAEVGELDPGREARRALLVPFIALSLSLFGALAHMAKFTMLTASLFRGYPLFKRRGIFAATALVFPVVTIVVCSWLPISPTTRTPLYATLESSMRLPSTWVVRGTIHGQTLGYPLSEAVRVHVLRGVDFGYQGDTP